MSSNQTFYQAMDYSRKKFRTNKSSPPKDCRIYWVRGEISMDNAQSPRIETAVASRKSERFTCIASLYLPLVKFLRLLGFCPFIIKQHPNTEFISYEFKLLSWLSFYSFCLCSLITYLCVYLIIYLVQIGFGWEFHKVLKFQGIYVEQGQLSRNLSFVSELGTRFVPVTFPLFTLISIIGALSFLPGFLKLLNNFSQFQHDYMETFPNQKDGKDDPFGTLGRYRSTTFMIFPMVGLAAVITVVAIMQDCDSWKGCLYPESFVWIPTGVACFTMLLLLGSHAVHFAVFRTLTEIFTQIGVGIRMWSECQNLSLQDKDMPPKKAVANYKKTLKKNMQKWTKIILSAKDLVKVTGRALALHHVLVIFINFIYLCLGVFSCLSAKLGSTEESSRGYVLLLFFAWGFAILISKAFVCEKILEQEKAIIVELRNLDILEHVPSLVQLNILIDLINEDPAEIRFWNVLTLNKSLLLQLIGQAATYLIVLIQFDNIERGRYML